MVLSYWKTSRKSSWMNKIQLGNLFFFQARLEQYNLPGSQSYVRTLHRATATSKGHRWVLIMGCYLVTYALCQKCLFTQSLLPKYPMVYSIQSSELTFTTLTNHHSLSSSLHVNSCTTIIIATKKMWCIAFWDVSIKYWPSSR